MVARIQAIILRSARFVDSCQYTISLDRWVSSGGT
jgi:hypothetical protein